MDNIDYINQIRSERSRDIYRDHISGVTEEEFRARCGAQNIWHSVDLGDVFVEGARKTSEILARENRMAALPDLTGKTVLDVGAFGGWFSFEAERRGADVTAIDYYSWIFDWPKLHNWVRSEKAEGRDPDPYNPPDSCVDLETCPGRMVFDTTKEILGSKVKAVTTTLEDFDAEPFDVVMYLGVLYHVENPMESLKKVASLTKGQLVLETLGRHIPGAEDSSIWEYFGGAEMRGDVTTWWAPNPKGLKDMLTAVGFSHVEVKSSLEELSDDQLTRPQSLRIWAHAFK